MLNRLQKFETRKLQLAGTGEQLMISNGYNRHNACCCCSPVPTRKNLLFADDSSKPLNGNSPRAMFQLSELQTVEQVEVHGLRF